MHNLDPPEPVSSNPRNGLFHTYCSMENIINHFMTRKIASRCWCWWAIWIRYVFCRFGEAVALATSSPRHYFKENVTIGAIMLPLTKANEQFQMQYSVIYSDWDILNSNGDKGLPQILYDLFWIKCYILQTRFLNFISCCMLNNDDPLFILSLWN